MTIAEARTSCKAALLRSRAYILALPRDVLLVAVLLLACSASFALGVQTGQGTAPRGAVSTSQASEEESPAPTSTPVGGPVVASKNGTRYYPPGCSGASRISPANKVSFASVQAAEAAGYSLAVGCKGD